MHENGSTTLREEEASDAQQGPNALSGEAAAAEEASAQQRLLVASSTTASPSVASSPSGGWRARLRSILESHMPVPMQGSNARHIARRVAA